MGHSTGENVEKAERVRQGLETHAAQNAWDSYMHQQEMALVRSTLANKVAQPAGQVVLSEAI